MIRLHEGSGSNEIQLEDQHYGSTDWERFRGVAIRLLERKGMERVAELLRRYPFVLYHGTNGFADEFDVLYFRAPMDIYVQVAEAAEDFQSRHDYRILAETVSEVCSTYVRFVAVDLDTNEGPEPVATPILEITSDVVERALRDAERLIATEGATSGVDRVHTAFHGYLRALAQKASLAVTPEANVTELFRAIREQHPGLQYEGARQSDIDKGVRALAIVVDTLNPVRNKASVAHPNEALLQEPEAMLVINVVRSLLHYLNARTRT